MAYPAGYKYTKDHEWIEISGDKGKVGITDYAQQQLGDVVYVELPEIGARLKQGQSFGTIEVHPGAPDPVAAKIEDHRLWRIDRCATALPASLDPSKHKHPVAEIAKLLSDDLELRPVFAGVGGEPVDALASAVAASIQSPDDPRVPLEVGGRELGE